MTTSLIHLPAEELAEFCCRHAIRRLALPGSPLSGDAQPDGALELLAIFLPGHSPGRAIGGIQDELSVLLGGRRVDLITPKFVKRRVRAQVLADAEVLYEA